MVNRKLKSLRVMRNICQKEMSVKLGMAVSTYNLKENGVRQFTVEEAKKIVEILETPFDEIFFKQNVPKKKTNKNLQVI
jgi:putative transcriptional regulator